MSAATPRTSVRPRKPEKKVPKFTLGILVGLLAITVLVVIITSLGGGESSKAQDPAKPPAVINPSDIEGAGEPTGTDAERAAAFNWLLKQGYKYVPGEHEQFSFTITKPVPTQRGASAVLKRPSLTVKELVREMNANTPQARAYRKYLKAQVSKKRLTKQDYERILQGKGLVRVQMLVPTVYERNTHLINGKVVSNASNRKAMAGDVAFVYAEAAKKRKLPNGRVEETSRVKTAGNNRGACGNPDVVFRPAKPGERVPSVNVPPPPPGTPPGKTPPGKTPPGKTPPSRPAKDPDSLRSLDGHGNGAGRAFPPDSERRYQGPPPAVRRMNPPVVTPPDRGGSYRPGQDPPPQNDSGGGTVTPPTAPPTPKPDPGPGTSPPPPPEQGAPSCC